MNYHEALNWIHSLYRFGSNQGLERIERILAELGNPHLRLHTVHIAGTNGKGSTAVMLAAMLEAQGFRTGLYTSPYLESFNNRMAINGRDINESELVRQVELLRPLTEKVGRGGLGDPTEFEVVTALAFNYFAGQDPDWVIVEVGLGGRLDATNVLSPKVCVITNIGLEHTQVLGDTVAKIAGEKAGIIKQGVPVVTAAEKPEALAVISEIAARRNAPLTVIDRDIAYSYGAASLDGQSFSYKSQNRSLENLKIGLLGRHQVKNAVTALAARELMPGIPFHESAVRLGLSSARWPGRLEVFSREPLVIVDGAHNADGIIALREALRELLGQRRLHLVLGILGDKAVEEIIGLIAPLATASLVITKPDNPRAADPYRVAEFATRHTNAAIDIIPGVADAVTLTVGKAAANDAVCISGSLYTISEARAALKKLL
ncbi:MAG: bifunctional folylpolyglutamate synthase/dihydrofolate synthase [Dethiobacter sp.]|nr:bifunctional folylpolyglutamate synthase/dihydrofolate synthase [Dethiobacter sp.]